MSNARKKTDMETDAAIDLFQSFHERAPREGEIVRSEGYAPEVILSVGELIGVIYKRGKDRYIHEFKATDRPGLFVSSDGQQAYIVAGRYVFTDRGFVD